MSLRGRDQPDLGGESTRDVDGLAADRHGSSGSWVGSATQRGAAEADGTTVGRAHG